MSEKIKTFPGSLLKKAELVSFFFFFFCGRNYDILVAEMKFNFKRQFNLIRWEQLRHFGGFVKQRIKQVYGLIYW